MDDTEKAMATNHHSSSSSSFAGDDKEEDHSSSRVVLKRKRTKRQRFLHLPAAAPVTTSSAEASSSAELSGSTTEEEEDMANCLILLARGRALDAGAKMEEESDGGRGADKFTSSRRFAEAAATTTTADGKAGFYVYECKTCNKSFPSFQALGGHRASHKKPKTMALAAEDKKQMDDDGLQITNSATTSSTAIAATATGGKDNKSRVHECSICGSEFSSGQALGGHMRRHRSLIVQEPQEVIKKEKSILSWDLNLPAPLEDDDHRDFPKSPAPSSFAFSKQQQSIIFSASPLVDCHY